MAKFVKHAWVVDWRPPACRQHVPVSGFLEILCEDTHQGRAPIAGLVRVLAIEVGESANQVARDVVLVAAPEMERCDEPLMDARAFDIPRPIHVLIGDGSCQFAKEIQLKSLLERVVVYL